MHYGSILNLIERCKDKVLKNILLDFINKVLILDHFLLRFLASDAKLGVWRFSSTTGTGFSINFYGSLIGF